jgi:SAM-dependent methyltransferase
MATPWDDLADAAQLDAYLAEWGPRFVPYQLDLVGEMAVAPAYGTSARAVGDEGRVLATDPRPLLAGICSEQVRRARFDATTRVEVAPAETKEGPFDVVVCAFGMFKIEDRGRVLRSWGNSLSGVGKIGLLTWGPADAGGALTDLHAALQELEPQVTPRSDGMPPSREDFDHLFDSAGLTLVRHTVLHHTLSFATAEAFVQALVLGSTWRAVAAELGEARFSRVAARFYDMQGGPAGALAFRPAATLAIAARPGSEVQLTVRASVKVPVKS